MVILNVIFVSPMKVSLKNGDCLIFLTGFAGSFVINIYLNGNNQILNLPKEIIIKKAICLSFEMDGTCILPKHMLFMFGSRFGKCL